MVKVSNEIIGSTQLNVVQRQSDQSQGSSARFASVLAEAVSGQDESAQAVAAAESISMLSEPSGGQTGATLLSRINTMVGQLDDYCLALADAGKNLKQIEPMLSQMQDLAAEIEQEMAGSNDEDLREIAARTVTQVAVETIKFQRGDYL